jgi:hypothetical protein
LKDIKQHNENLCSIAGIENTFSGRNIIREFLNKLLPETVLIIAQAQRPYYEPEFLEKSILRISSEFENSEIDEDWFSLSFKYYAKENNDSFIQIFSEIWFDYEQAVFSFFVTGQQMQLYKNLNIDGRMSWKDITASSPSYVLCKGAEEDVLWIGKSVDLNFDGFIV